MRVLWFSNSSSQFPQDSDKNVTGGWIPSLQSEIEKISNVHLGIAFFHESCRSHVTHNGVKYFPIYRKRKKKIRRFFENWAHKVNDKEDIQCYKSIVNDFKPQVIHVFGTEKSFLFISQHTSIPVVVHIQGFINPCLNAWYFPGLSSCDFFFRDSFVKLVLGNSYIHDYIRFKARAKQEMSMLPKVKYVMGRTFWDKSITGLLAPKAKYFHCDEMLRPSFYNKNTRHSKVCDRFKIVTTISSEFYKGLDVIFRTLRVLCELSDFDFEWHVYGVEEKSRFSRFVSKSISFQNQNGCMKFKGRVKEEEIYKALTEADVFVHPSYIDNSPNSVCEAQIVGLPVIATNVGGLSSLIRNGIDGILVPANDPYILAHSILNLEKHPKKAFSIGEAGREKAKLRHCKSRIIANLLDTYRLIIDDGNK